GGGRRPARRARPAETETYLVSMQYDEFGLRSSMRLGNGVSSTYTYDPLTRRLASLQTVTPRRSLQVLTYAYDRVGNLLTQSNGLPPSTNQSSGPVSVQYAYDALDRLLQAQAVADAAPGLIDQYSTTFQYSDIHNLLHNVQVRQLVHGPGNVELPGDTNHDFAYLYAGAGPHQATQIGDKHLVYDLNGNTAFQCLAATGTCAGSGDTTGL